MYTLPLHAATSVVANNALPNFDKVMSGALEQNPVISNNGLTMDITQTTHNAVIKWNSFDVGGSATVNFWGPDNHNTLNYVNSANMSQIYGTINANNSGNIFIVNPAGVQIGNSAQINVGSLYVSNKTFSDDLLKTVNDTTVMNEFMKNGTANADAALMSLGNINANKVTFEGNGRIVIDSERLLNSDGNSKNTNFEVHTDDAGNVLIGYDAYVDTDKDGDGHIDGYKNQDRAFNQNVFVNGQNPEDNVKGYMWVEDVKQLQAINTNLSGNYALRNSIDATSTANGEGFNPIGLYETGKVVVNNNNEYGFTGNFDGLDYNIFGLTINRESEANVGLFGVAHNANINNVTLVGGSITGGSVVGSVVGAALGTTHITNATNSASVTGNTDVGGIVGYSGNKLGDGTVVDDDKEGAHFTNLVNTGTVHSKGESDGNGGIVSNAGGLIGYMYNGKLDGNSYNLGDVSGKGYNVGGLVGHAVNSTIGDGTNLVYNRMDVTGAYNVGGIVGNMEGSTVKYAENSGTVMASGSVTYKYNYHTDIANEDNLPAGSSLNDGIVSIDVNVANVGGIAGSSSDSSTIKDVTNTGDVSSGKGNDTENVNNQEYDYEYYTAGNVGGIVGSAVNTNITNATNRENEIRGAHNVGGVVGYFSGTGTIDKGINDGGDIMATGARNGNGFVMESVRQSGDEDFIIGNIGGIVGYMDGKGVKVTGSANRGTVHTENIEDADNVLTISKAANVGGIVGKIDANTNKAGLLSDFRNGNYKNASVSNSYNTGNVTGYTGVGGVIGMMYNGSVAGSYNQGAINTTRQVYRGGGSNIDPLNMGGIVGDTTEQTSASAVIYDVYNEGQIGDENFEFYARHVGGIVGRLSGTVDKAYNTGDIYNNDTAVGGIVGWWYNGNIKNVFNTGNITVRSATELQVGGIAGAAEMGYKTLENAYNLGTIRGYKERVDNLNNPQDGADSDIYVGGIIGRARGGKELTIRNVYTMGNLYAGVGTYNNATGTYSYKHTEKNGLGAIYGGDEEPTLQGANYIIRDSKDFKDLSRQSGVNDIIYSDRYTKDAYDFVNVDEQGNKIFSNQDGGAVNNATDNNWRIYEGSTTPILNAFLPNVEDYFDDNNNMTNINTIQYGTAYNPLLTIIKATGDLSYDWKKLGISGAASLAVYGGGLTLDNVDTSGGTGYYSGLLYTDKDLTLIATNKNNEPDATKVSGDIGLGSGAELYGSSVKIEADGTVTVYGSVTATGETEGSTGDVNIKAGDVDVYGTLTTGKSVSIAGIEGSAQKVDTNFENVNNPNEAMIHISERFAHKINSANGATSNITINAGTKLVVDNDGEPILDAEGNKQYVNIGDGNVNLYFGNKEQGLITTGGSLTVTGTGDVYVDSDLDIGGNLTLNGTGADSEVVLDITNIGQVQAKNGTVTDAVTGLHNFMHHFSNTDGGGTQAGHAVITLNAEQSGDAKLAVDMWDYESNSFDLKKYDSNGHTFKDELDEVTIRDIDNNELTASEVTYIWVTDADQLQGINNNGTDGLEYNYALKGDINASGVNNYKAIGTGSNTGFTGTFDGRGNRIIGLDTTKDSKGGNSNTLTNAGIFSTVGEGGVVKDVNIYSGNFTGSAKAGAVAGENNGRIEGVVTFGNTVTVTGDGGNAGGIVGVNNGNNGKIVTNEDGTITLEPVDDELLVTGIIDVESTGSVIAGGSSAVAGGLVGTNDGALGNSYSNSAVTANKGTGSGLGGVVGVNTANGNVQYVDSLGVTNGGAHLSNNVGGIIGINSGNMYSGYNESIVSGSSNVGGIIGTNAGTYNEADKKWESGTVSNVVNATSVTSDAADSKNIGGLVGTNTGSVTNGRNNGTITGTNYVGGLVGDNADENSILTNLVNDSSAEILGEEYVGGIAGSNSGTITADEKNDNLVNRGSITGVQYVGGITGENKGTITNTNNDVELFVNTDKVTADKQAQYFGGVAGINQNGGIIKDATNTADVNAYGATYVGGVVGKNDGTLQDMAGNSGNVTGKNFVGGVAGQNNIALDGVNASNDGVVKATEGGAGGIFAENNADIINSTLTNNKIVAGGAHTGATGGIIGKNSGDITKTSLKNEVNGQVIGMNNVGGLIGENTGKIEGGRDDADSYYKYQIYNNGVINVGTWTDNDGDGIVDAGEIQGLAEGATSTNIGGLIGYNTTEIINGVIKHTGSLTAGYNTGAINAGSSSNVGGIVGNNAGKVDQVFNTVMTPEGEGAITGGNNVGGLIGTNSGTLSNAYNTTEVKPTNSGVVGNAVGENSGTITNIYASNTSGNLIGTGYDNGKVKNAYSFSDDDNGTNNITVITEDGRQNSDSYNGFDFDSTGATKDGETAASDGTEDYWKIYTGSGNPLLKVFLTTVTVDADNLPNLVYNTKDQDLIIGSLIGENGAFSADDDFKAYQNNNSLIQNTDFEHKNAGTYDNWLYSGQIASGSQEEGTFNPNNLGYDIEFKADIDKAQITVDLNQVDRVYGNTDIINGEYGFSYGFNNVLSDADKTALIDELNKNSVLNMNDVNAATDDKALVENGNKTNDAGSYDWTGTVNIAKNYQGNYEFVVKDTGTIDNGGATITTTGDSIVNKRQLSVSDIIANIVYGNQDGKGFIVSGGELIGVNGNAGIVYDDKVKLDTSLKVEDANIIANSSYASNKGNRVTADAGTYENSLNFSGLGLSGDDANNYVLVNDSFGGTIEVTQATINVDLNDVDRIYGSTAFNGNGYAVSDVQHNANGDSYNANDFVVSVNVGNDGALTGNDTGKVTNDVGAYSYIGTVISNNEKLNQNYKIVVNNSEANNNIGSGVSTVSKADLSVTINNVDTVYGTVFDESKYGYTLDNLVNGDGNSSDIVNVIENAINNASGGYNNTGAADGTNGKVTQDAEGDYSLSFKNDITKEEILKNYNITTVTNGDANVSKKQISIGANDEEIHVGEVPVYTGTDINGVLVNGDKLSGDYHYGVADNAIESVVGKHNGVIGVWLNGTFYDLSLNTDWSKVSGLEFFSNYAVDYKPGTLTVTEQVMPDLPDNWPGNRWDYLFNDAPFDRNKNFRERKAEVNFVDGGMEV